MSQEYCWPKALLKDPEHPRSKRVLLQSPSHGEEVESSMKGQPKMPVLDSEAGGRSNMMMNDSSRLLHEIRQLRRENQMSWGALNEQMNGFLNEMKQIFSSNAKSAPPPARTPTASPVGRPRKRTPKSAPPPARMNNMKASTRIKYDPNFPQYDHKSIITFEQWFTKGGSCRNERLLRLASKVVPLVDVHWFESIWSKQGFLCEQHIDVVTSLLAKEHDVDIVRGARRQWTWIEAGTWDILADADFAAVPASLWPYVTGSRPTEAAKPWRRATRVIGFGRVLEKHWVCYELSFEKQRITVFDPNNLHWGMVCEAFTNLSIHIPAMCRMGRVWEAHKFTKPLLRKWDVVPYPCPPLAATKADSGVLALKVMQSLAHDVEPNLILGTRCDFFRKHFCGKLFSTSPDTAGTSTP